MLSKTGNFKTGVFDYVWEVPEKRLNISVIVTSIWSYWEEVGTSNMTKLGNV